MKEDIIIFTHNDLDAMGCLLVLNETFKDEYNDKHVFHTNYQNIPEIVKNIINQCEVKKPKLVVITDVSFSTSVEDLDQLYNYCTNRDIRMLYMDHHLYPDNFFANYPEMKTVWDKSRCASKICYDTLLKAEEHIELGKLIRIIDIYDIWQDQNKLFDFSQRFNDYFWYRITKKAETIVQLACAFKIIGYKLFDDFMTVTEDIVIDNRDNLERLENSGLVHRNLDEKVSLFFSNDYFTPFMINEHRNGQKFVINICNWGLIKVRVNQHFDISEKVLDNIRLRCAGTVDIGHSHAFTWKSPLDFNNNPQDCLITEAKRITSIISQELNPVYAKAMLDFDDDIPF